MPFLTKYGTQYGALPQTMGNVFFVSPTATYTIGSNSYPASDEHDGLSPERALSTISQAITN